MDRFILRPRSIATYYPPLVVSCWEIARKAYGYVVTEWTSVVFLEHQYEHYSIWLVVIHRPSLTVRQTPEVP